MRWILAILPLMVAFVPLTSANGPPWVDDEHSLQGVVYDVAAGTLQGATVTLIRFEDGWKIEHFVYHSVERTENGVTVIHFVYHLKVGDDDKIAENRTIYTDTEGRFKFENLEEGDYALLVGKPGYTEYVIYFELERDMNLTVYLLDLQPTYTISGTVLNIETSRPVANASLELEGGGNTYLSTSDAEGFYRFDNLAAGEYQLGATHDNFHTFEVKVLIIDSSQTVEVMLAPVPIYILQGSVYSATSGEPLLAQVDVRRVVDGAGVEFYSLTTDAQGGWILEIPAKGVYYLTVSAEGHTSYEGVIRLTGDLSLQIYLVDNRTPTYRLEGMVYDGGPIEGAAVSLISFENETPYFTVTNLAGQYVFDNVPEGSYLLSVSADGYHGFRQALTLDANKTVNAILEPIPVCYVSGSVRDTEGSPLAGALVELSAGTQITLTLTDSAGQFEFRPVAIGDYELSAELEGYVEWSQFLTLRSDLSAEIVLSPATGRVDVEVLNPITQAPLEGRIEILREGEVIESVWANQASWTLPKGVEYTLRVDGDEISSYERTFELTSAGFNFTVYLRTAFDIGGEVVWRDAQGVLPLQGRQVRLISTGLEPWFVSTLTGLDGRWVIRDVVPGTYEFRFENAIYELEVSKAEFLRVVDSPRGPNVVCPELSGVITLDGEPYGNLVTLRLYDGASYGRVATGSYSFDDVPVGTYTLEAVWTDARGEDHVWRERVELGHEPVELAIELETPTAAVGWRERLRTIGLLLLPFVLLLMGFVVAALMVRRALARRGRGV